MKRRSFIASIVAGLVAPFLPRGEVEARDVFVPDTTYQSDMATVFELPEIEGHEVEWLARQDWGECIGHIEPMYIPDPEHPGRFLLLQPSGVCWEDDTCIIDYGLERKCLTSS